MLYFTSNGTQVRPHNTSNDTQVLVYIASNNDTRVLVDIASNDTQLAGNSNPLQKAFSKI